MTILANSTTERTQTTTNVGFIFEEQQIRTVIRDTECWFVAADVCNALNLTNASKSVSSLDDDEKYLFNGDSNLKLGSAGNGAQVVILINESGLYTLILRCRDAVKQGTLPWRFRKWVTNEILPNIRKTGSYSAPNPRQNAEPLNANDMVNLKWLINMMTVRFKYQEAWNQGIWYSLRRATGTPSPHPFSVEDLPALSQECRRIMEVTNDASALICQFEKDVLKHVIRNRKDFDAIASKMQNDFQLLQIPMEGMQTLEKFEEVGLMRLERRAQ